VCFELGASSIEIKYLLLSLVKSLDIWLIPHLRNLTFVRQNYVIFKRDMNQICQMITLVCCLVLSALMYSFENLSKYTKVLVFQKLFASFRLCDLVDSFLAIVHLVCLMGSHE
jgi:hypothetical protein